LLRLQQIDLSLRSQQSHRRIRGHVGRLVERLVLEVSPVGSQAQFSVDAPSTTQPLRNKDQHREFIVPEVLCD
jgi:hypothetical protein